MSYNTIVTKRIDNFVPIIAIGKLRDSQVQTQQLKAQAVYNMSLGTARSLIAMDDTTKRLGSSIDKLWLKCQAMCLTEKYALNSINGQIKKLQNDVASLQNEALQNDWRPCQVQYRYVDENDNYVKWVCSLFNIPYNHELSQEYTEDDWRILFKTISIHSAAVPDVSPMMSTNFKIQMNNGELNNSGGAPVQLYVFGPGETESSARALIFGFDADIVLQTQQGGSHTVNYDGTVDAQMLFDSLFLVGGTISSRNITWKYQVWGKSVSTQNTKRLADRWISGVTTSDSIDIPIPSQNIQTSSIKEGYVESSDFGPVMHIPVPNGGTFVISNQADTLQRSFSIMFVEIVGTGVTVRGKSYGPAFRCYIMYPSNKRMRLYDLIDNAPNPGQVMVHDSDIRWDAPLNLPYDLIDSLTGFDYQEIHPPPYDNPDPVTQYAGTSTLTFNNDNPNAGNYGDPINATTTWTEPIYGDVQYTADDPVSGTIQCLAPPIGYVDAMTYHSEVMDIMQTTLASFTTKYSAEMNQMFGLFIDSVHQFGMDEIMLSAEVYQISQTLNQVIINLNNLTKFVQGLAADYAAFKTNVSNYINAQINAEKTSSDFVHEWLPIIVGGLVIVAGTIAVIATGGAAALLLAAPTIFGVAQMMSFTTSACLAAAGAFLAGNNEDAMYYTINAVMYLGGAIGQINGSFGEGSNEPVAGENETAVTLSTENISEETAAKLKDQGVVGVMKDTADALDQMSKMNKGNVMNTELMKNIQSVMGTSSKVIDELANTIQGSSLETSINNAINKIVNSGQVAEDGTQPPGVDTTDYAKAYDLISKSFDATKDILRLDSETYDLTKASDLSDGDISAIYAKFESIRTNASNLN